MIELPHRAPRPTEGKYQHAGYEQGPRCECLIIDSLPLTCPQLLTFKRETKPPLINNPDQLTRSESLIV